MSEPNSAAINIRLPEKLRAAALQLAASRGQSLNSMVRGYLLADLKAQKEGAKS